MSFLLPTLFKTPCVETILYSWSELSQSDDKLSIILDYLTLDRQKLYFSNSAQKSGVVCLLRPRVSTRLAASPSPRVPTSLCPHVPETPRPHVSKSYVPVPLLVTAQRCLWQKVDRGVRRLLPIMAYMGKLHRKGYLFHASGIYKGRDFTS